MATFNALIRPTEQKKNGEFLIYIRISVNPVKRYYSIGVSVPAELWDEDKQIVKAKHPRSIAINQVIRELLAKLEDAHFNAQLSRKKLFADDYLNLIQKKETEPIVSLKEYSTKHLSRLANPATKASRKARIDKIFKWNPAADFSNINHSSLKDYQQYLVDAGNNPNTTINSFKNLVTNSFDALQNISFSFHHCADTFFGS